MTEIEERILKNQVQIMYALERVGDKKCTEVELNIERKKTIELLRMERDRKEKINDKI